MASAFFSSNYRQYKQDTEYIAGWLAEGAQKAGYRRSTEPQPHQQQLRQPQQPPTPTTYRISVGEFVPMAETIANQQPKVVVPGALSRLFTRAIKARQKAAEWFGSSHENTIVDESNRTHAHFVDILQKVAAILRPLVPEPEPRKATQQRPHKSKPSATHKLSNVFSHLVVEDTHELDDTQGDENGASDTATKYDEPLESLPPVNPVEIHQDETEIEAEFFFAVQSFITTVHDVRDMVQETWFEYKDGKVDSIKASLIANTAIDLVRHAESEFDLLLKRPTKYPAQTFPVWSLPALLFLHQHPGFVEHNDILEFCLPSGLMMPRSQNCTHVYWCLWPVYSGLKYYLDATLRGKKPKTDVLNVSRSAFDPVNGAHEDAWRTIKLAEKFRHITVQHKSVVSIDEITRGMAYMFKSRTVPIWVTFGMQILLDVQDILGPSQVEAPFQELHDFLDYQIAATEALRQSWSLPFGTGDVEGPDLDFIASRLEQSKSISGDSCDSLRQNPFRCGLFRYDANVQLRESWLALEFQTAQICVMAHLYTATKLLHPTAPKWPDMEFLISVQDPDRLFFGGTPTTLGESHRKARLLLGQSSVHTTFNLRKGKRQRSGKQYKDRWIRDTSVLARIFNERTSWAVSDESVDTQVKLLNNKLQSPAELTRLAIKLGTTSKSLAFHLQKRRWRPYIEEHMDNENGPTAMLRDLSVWLDGDAVDLHFSWQALHEQCGKMWKHLIRSLLDDPDWDSRLSLNPGLGVYIIDYAAKDEVKWGRTATEDPSFARPLRKAFDAIQATILELQADNTSELGVFAVDDGTSGCSVRGGDVCLTRLMEEVKGFADMQFTLDKSDLLAGYANWPKDAMASSRVFKFIELAIKARYDEMMSIFRNQARYSLDELLGDECGMGDDFDGHDACDACANCPRCRRRDFLGHRYPGYYKPQRWDEHGHSSDSDDDGGL
ncbi:hypothetical protein BDV95DRAFT_480836 [Massariosphaeria phaeospora]|uniref:DUF6604 domain-containing protein n=1 Tax=Massariosphaeria phaeospora TaxID=100035 RepID=A0A7C8IHE9_9PLEO|nr:hypothetical protein BDV95DRAFT_480836 [Massariosphaeria phaeospora]